MSDINLIINNAILYAKSFENTGKVATYIPELAKVKHDALGVCIVDDNRNIYKSGDFDTSFTMQSISKVFALIMALELLGEEKVFSLVGVEPTGDAFNSMIRLETQTHIPFNPMINAGAISVAGMLNECSDFDEYLEFIRRLCGREDVYVNEDIFVSEQKTGMKNRAIAYFLANDGVIKKEIEMVLDYYFKLCSVNVDTVDLAHMGSILANDGIDIFTGERCIKSRYATIAKTLMFTCGLYDGSGAFSVNVGIPSKSGVGGGIMCSSCNGFGIGVYGPALDDKGNSMWGLKVLEYLSKELKLHCFSKM